MKHNTNNSPTVRHTWTRFIGATIMLALMVSTTTLSQGVYSNPSAVNLLTSGNFGALAGTDLVIGASCTVTGNVGGSTVSNSGTVTGSTNIADATWTTATNDLNTVFAELLTRAVDFTFAAVDIGGLTLGRGVYQADASGTLSITGTLTLTGTATDIFIIRTGTSGTPGTSLITAASSIVTMGGTALASNVYWVIGTSTALGGNSTFNGNILAGTTIMQNSNVSFEGKALGKTTVTLNGLSVLPVEMMSFTATANRLNAELRWSTATEVNNYGFEIERRQTGSWATVGFVEGAGTSSSPRDYSYTDKSLSPGRYTYRIKQIDNTGSFLYKNSAEVEIGLTAKVFELASNYPNPFNPSTTIQFTLGNDGMTSLQVYNMLGQKVATLFQGAAEAGKMYQVTLDASNLPSGLYFAKLESGNQHTIQKMVLLK